MNKNELKTAAPIAQREIRYDILRVFAAIMVVMIHVSANRWYTTPYNSLEWAITNFYDSVVRSAVPLFFMLSGAFVLKKQIDFKKLYFKKILWLVITYFVWSFLYAVDTFNIAELKNTPITDFIKVVIVGHYHLWFLPILAGLYILQPILFAIVHFEEGKYTKYALFCFLCFGILKSTALSFFENNEIVKSALSQVTVELTEYTGYMILGYYLANQKKIKMKPVVAVILFAVTVALSTVIVQLDALRRGEASAILYGNFALPVFIESILVFAFFQNIGLKAFSGAKTQGFIQTLSSLTLGVYLLHPYILDRFEVRFNLGAHPREAVILIPVITLAISVICFLVTFIMTKIPIIKEFWQV